MSPSSLDKIKSLTCIISIEKETIVYQTLTFLSQQIRKRIKRTLEVSILYGPTSPHSLDKRSLPTCIICIEIETV